MKEFKWAEFYMKLADKLLAYKNDRLSLLEVIKDMFEKANIKLPTLEKDNNIIDIDPFTVFALFNKGIRNESRILLLETIKELLNISEDVPQEFDGIPVVNPMKATFYYFVGERNDKDIDTLWNFFEAALYYADNDGANYNQFVDLFNAVSKQKGINWNITMGLYWIRPYAFINLDARNRKLLENNNEKFGSKFDIVKLLKKVPAGEDYLKVISFVKDNMTEYTTFPELSYDAWKQSTEDKEKFYGENKLEYWPSIEEYNPKLTKDDWKKFILEIEKPNHPRPMQMLKALMDIGGEATCKKLSETYGGTVSGYVGCSVAMGRRVKKFFDLPACMDDGQERFFAIPLLGRRVKNDNNENNYSYRIRPELLDALNEIDLSDVSTYYVDDNRFGIFDSWEIIDEYTAVKTCDKSFFDYRSSGVPKDICWFFDAENLEDGESKSITFIYNDAKYDSKLSCESRTNRRVRVFWGTELGKEFDLYKTQNVKVQFLKTESNNYKLSIINGEMKMNKNVFDKNIVLYGPPGTGKTYNTVIYSVAIIEDKTLEEIGSEEYKNVIFRYNKYKSEGKVEFTTFHQSYGYEEFIEGIKPVVNETLNGTTDVTYDVLPGIFKMFCENAMSNSNDSFVFIIDEINRGNISKILGELITLIEPTKRVGQPEEMKAKLPYSQKDFGVPDNVYIIGTMNTADRSIAAIDTALRRRFSFKEMLPQTEVLKDISVAGLSISAMLEKINRRIEVLYDREHTIGHAYFIQLQKDDSIDCLGEIFKNKIIPLLQEYFYEDYDKIRLVLGDNQKIDEPEFIIKEQIDENELFGEDTDVIEDAYKYSINKEAFTNIESYKKMV